MRRGSAAERLCWCCCQSVEATIPEAILIAERLSEPADPRRAKVLAACGKRQAGHSTRGKPCALLIDNRCSVYDDRPLVSRGVTAADGDACRTSYLAALAGQDAPVEIFAVAQYFILADQAGMRGILKDMGLQYDRIELIPAVAAILRDPGVVDRWLARAPAFGPEMVVSEPAPEPV
jgi:hypothetical protein